MKGGVAAFITAVERFVAKNDQHPGSIAVLLTSDEEGPAIHGTKVVIEKLTNRDEKIDYCIVGEPSSTTKFGDIIRNGRRGSLGAHISVHGTQGHVAYPHLADNPIHRAMPALSELTEVAWDKGDEHFPPTTLQISNFNAGTGATNVIPAIASIELNLRYSPAISIEHIQSSIESLFKRHNLNVTIEWKDSARPFITQQGTLCEALQSAIEKHTGSSASLDTGGGTSDGRFIAPTGAQVVEFGPINKTIHQIDERISCRDIETLSSIYEATLVTLLER